MKQIIIIKENKLKEIMRECIKEFINENKNNINKYGSLGHPISKSEK